MGNVAPYPTGRQAHRARVGVARHKGTEARGDDVGIRSADYTDSHGQMLCLVQKYEKGYSTSTGMTYKSKKNKRIHSGRGKFCTHHYLSMKIT
jgi:hypothetical protein